jgi:hypothetical protein
MEAEKQELQKHSNLTLAQMERIEIQLMSNIKRCYKVAYKADFAEGVSQVTHTYRFKKIFLDHLSTIVGELKTNITEGLADSISVRVKEDDGSSRREVTAMRDSLNFECIELYLSQLQDAEGASVHKDCEKNEIVVEF